MLPEQTAGDKLDDAAVTLEPQPAAAEQVTTAERFDISKSSNVRELVRNFDHYVKSHLNYGNISEGERADLDNRILSYAGLMAQESPGDSDMTLPQLLRVYKLLWAGHEQSEGGAATGVDLLKCNNSNDLIDMLYSLVTQHQRFAEVDEGGNNRLENWYKDYKLSEDNTGGLSPGFMLDMLLSMNAKLSLLTVAQSTSEVIAATTPSFDISQYPDGHSFVNGLYTYLQGHPQFTTIIPEHERIELASFITSFRGLMERAGMGDSLRPMEMMLDMYQRIQQGESPVRKGFFDIGQCKDPDVLVHALYQHVLNHQNLNTLSEDNRELLEGFYDEYKRRNGATVEPMVECLVSANYTLEHTSTTE